MLRDPQSKIFVERSAFLRKYLVKLPPLADLEALAGKKGESRVIMAGALKDSI